MAEVKRIWIRSADGRWIVPPVGAGEDANIRSVNVMGADGVWRSFAPFDNANFETFNYYDPELSWTDNFWGDYNPNYYSVGHRFHTNKPPGYVRLSHVAKKNDPTWRSVSLNQNIPSSVPSLPVKGSEGILSPRGGSKSYHKLTYHTTSEEFNITTDSVWANGHSFASNPRDTPFGTTFSTSYAVGHDETSANGIKLSDFKSAVLLDIRCITQQLATRWPQSNYFVGQYFPLMEMELKRVIIRGLFYTGLRHGLNGVASEYDVSSFPELGEVFDSYQGTLRISTNVPSVSIPQWAYEPRIPASVTSMGDVIISQNGLPVQSTRTDLGVARSISHPFSINIEGPYVTDIAIYPEVSYTTSTGFSSVTRHKVNSTTGESVYSQVAYPIDISAQTGVKINSIDIQYALPGKDVPDMWIPEEYGIGGS